MSTLIFKKFQIFFILFDAATISKMPARTQRTAQALIYNGFSLCGLCRFHCAVEKSDEIAEIFVAALLVVQFMTGIYIYMYLALTFRLLIAAQELLCL